MSLAAPQGWFAGCGAGVEGWGSLGGHGQAGQQRRGLLAALGRHVLQALRVEPVEVQPEGQNTPKAGEA